MLFSLKKYFVLFLFFYLCIFGSKTLFASVFDATPHFSPIIHFDYYQFDVIINSGNTKINCGKCVIPMPLKLTEKLKENFRKNMTNYYKRSAMNKLLRPAMQSPHFVIAPYPCYIIMSVSSSTSALSLTTDLSKLTTCS